MCLKQPAVCLKKLIQGYPGFTTEMSLSGKQDKLLPRKQIFKSSPRFPQFGFPNLVQSIQKMFYYMKLVVDNVNPSNVL